MALARLPPGAHDGVGEAARLPSLHRTGRGKKKARGAGAPPGCCRGICRLPVGAAGGDYRREAGPTIWNESHCVVSHETTPGRAAESIPFSHHQKKIMKVHGKATKPFGGFLTLAASSPGRDRGAASQGSFRPRGGFRPSGGLGDHERPVVCPTLRTWFHSTYIKHKPELTNGFLPGSAAPHGCAAVAPRWREVHSQIRCEVTKTNRNKQTT